MTTYKVIWSDIAADDLNKIIDYIIADSVNNALHVFNKIRDKCSKLYSYPNRGRIVPELEEYGILLYRELIIEPWRVIYRVSGKSVYVLSVIDSRQNVEDILLNRFTNKGEK